LGDPPSLARYRGGSRGLSLSASASHGPNGGWPTASTRPRQRSGRRPRC